MYVARESFGRRAEWAVGASGRGMEWIEVGVGGRKEGPAVERGAIANRLKAFGSLVSRLMPISSSSLVAARFASREERAGQ